MWGMSSVQVIQGMKVSQIPFTRAHSPPSQRQALISMLCGRQDLCQAEGKIFQAPLRHQNSLLHLLRARLVEREKALKLSWTEALGR